MSQVHVTVHNPEANSGDQPLEKTLTFSSYVQELLHESRTHSMFIVVPVSSTSNDKHTTWLPKQSSISSCQIMVDD